VQKEAFSLTAINCVEKMLSGKSVKPVRGFLVEKCMEEHLIRKLQWTKEFGEAQSRLYNVSKKSKLSKKDFELADKVCKNKKHKNGHDWKCMILVKWDEEKKEQELGQQLLSAQHPLTILPPTQSQPILSVQSTQQIHLIPSFSASNQSTPSQSFRLSQPIEPSQPKTQPYRLRNCK